jgi:hypothetical protein
MVKVDKIGRNKVFAIDRFRVAEGERPIFHRALQWLPDTVKSVDCSIADKLSAILDVDVSVFE